MLWATKPVGAKETKPRPKKNRNCPKDGAVCDVTRSLVTGPNG